jgi:hypothetical protein
MVFASARGFLVFDRNMGLLAEPHVVTALPELVSFRSSMVVVFRSDTLAEKFPRTRKNGASLTLYGLFMISIH